MCILYCATNSYKNLAEKGTYFIKEEFSQRKIHSRHFGGSVFTVDGCSECAKKTQCRTSDEVKRIRNKAQLILVNLSLLCTGKFDKRAKLWAKITLVTHHTEFHKGMAIFVQTKGQLTGLFQKRFFAHFQEGIVDLLVYDATPKKQDVKAFKTSWK